MSSSLSRDTLAGGRYEIERELGRGGTATVYLAREPRHDRRVAVKVLSPTVTEELGLDRFLTEIRTTAQLSHPHILPLIDSGHEHGAPYYVMPFAEGGSLRDLIRREGPLPLDRALGIASAVATALAHAHARDVTHRDVKPGNILLDREGNPYLADFGIARVPRDPDDTQRTDTGQPIGTPRYMSPEQIDGARELASASDIYSLAFVIYEMLDGAPPFPASSPAAHVAAQLRNKLPRSPRIPKDVRRLLQRALSQVPAERPTAAALAESLEAMRSRRRVPRTLKVAGLAAALVAVVGYGVSAGSAMRGEVALDTTRYAVLPFERLGSMESTLPIEALVVNALAEWEEITVVDGLRMPGGPPGPTESAPAYDEARDLAVAWNTGRLVTGEIRSLGDSLGIELVLRDPTFLAEGVASATVVISSGAVPGDAAVARGAELLLLGQTPRAGTLSSQTRSLRAAREFVLGERARDDWDLVAAVEHFGRAAEHDRYFDLALLWKAQAMNWRGSLSQEWAVEARRAAGAGDLPPRDRILASGLAALADARYPDACRVYEELSARSPADFAALFGLGECHGDDPVVVPDPTSDTGWGFRGSAHAAVTAYRQAFQILPSSYRAFGAGSSELAGRLLYTGQGAVRRGRGPPPEERGFMGFQEWRSDTLAFVAVPMDSAMLFEPDPVATEEALAHQRGALLDVANTWARAFPTSGGALYALALARELVGDPSALQTYREARRLANDERTVTLSGAAEVMLSVRLYLAGDLAGLERAVALADTILSGNGSNPTQSAAVMAELAVLLGRPNLAAQLSRDADVGRGLGDTPTEVSREARALLAFAAVGAPADSLRSLENRVTRMIQQAVPQAARGSVLQSTLEQPAFLAFPAYTMSFLTSDLVRLPEARAAAALASHGPQVAIGMLGEPPAAPAWDVMLARANVLVAADRSRAALELLSSRLDRVAMADPSEVSGMGRVGSLVRAAILRADLEASVGSRAQAPVWARAALILWSGHDGSMTAVVNRMRGILDANGRD